MSGRFIFTKIIVSDVDRLLAFYRDAFGMTQITRISHGAGVDELDEIIMGSAGSAGGANAGHTLVIQRFPNRPIPACGEVTLGFIVADIDQAIKGAVAAGATITRPVWDEPDHGIRVAFIKDPDGHLIEVVQMIQRQGG